MAPELHGTIWGILYTVTAAGVGIFCLLLVAIILPKVLHSFTPQIDEEKEILRGNQAVAEYNGRIVSALIIGISIIIGIAIYVGLN